LPIAFLLVDGVFDPLIDFQDQKKVTSNSGQEGKKASKQ